MKRLIQRFSIQRERILELALSGHEPKALANYLGVTEWTIRRALAREHRRQQRPYWKQQVTGPMPRAGEPC